MVLIEKKEKVVKTQQISIARHEIKSIQLLQLKNIINFWFLGYWIPEQPEQDILSIKLEGAFLPSYYSNISTRFLDFWVEAYERPNSDQMNVSVLKNQVNNAWVSFFQVSFIAKILIFFFRR